MHTTQTRRVPYISKDGTPHYDGIKSVARDLVSGKDAKYDQENIPNGTELVNGSTPVIPDSYVGYSNIPNQIFRRAVRKGFEFNLMVVGETGLGKSTFINSLFLTDIYNVENPGPSFKAKHTENGVSLKLTVIDTPGFGDSVNNSECWQPILNFIDARFDEYLAAEGRVSRNSVSIPDKRVHACLYFIAPTDSVNNSECWQPILNFIDARFDEYLAAEGRVSRNSVSIPDKRVHACLYFIAPTGMRVLSPIYL
ncbi:unnamed protein product [Schistocephalus solidus]|uniref:Septin-type G domain-containing protein n=1 Tax=Schistocephalus solidus TaxID=70667 RepID=A0A183TS38_SCHSO|nr:unnamed protein product [Schistocephalus solidus]